MTPAAAAVALARDAPGDLAGVGSPSAGERGAIVLAVVIFACLSLTAAAFSRGFLAADGCMHYLYARFAFRFPMAVVDVWGRPFCTLWYAIPAITAGRFGVCVASLVTALGCSAVAWGIAGAQRQRLPVLALLFTLGQPLLFLHTLTAMTELPFALLLGAAFLAYQYRRWTLAAVMVSLTPLARPEGFGFVALAAIALVATRSRPAITRLLLLPLPLVAWDLAGWLISGRVGPWWNWLPANWPYSAGSLYGRGNLLVFVAALPIIVSPLVLPATLIGLAESFHGLRGTRFDHARLCRTLTAAIPLFVLGVHSLLYAAGKLASYGEPRYLLVAAPFWGVCSARGWEWAFARAGWPSPVKWAGVAVLAVIVANVAHPVVPLRPTPDWLTADRAADWYGANARAHRLIAAHPEIFYHLDLCPMDSARTLAWHRSNLLHPVAGSVLIWDPIYGDLNASTERVASPAELEKAGWKENVEASALLNGNHDDSIGLNHRWHVFEYPARPALGVTANHS